MTNKEKLIIKANREGFVSLDNLVKPNDRYYPIWMLELVRWFAMNHRMTIQIESVSGGKFYSCIMSDRFYDYELNEDTLEEEVIDTYDQCVEDALLCAFGDLDIFRKREQLKTN